MTASDRGGEPDSADANSNLAWFPVNCPDPRSRNIPEGVQLAKKATELHPRSSGRLLALGVAHYRAGKLHAAVADLEKPTDLRPRENSIRQLFLAMAHWQLGDRDKSCNYYRQAVEWLDNNQARDPEELCRFRAEAAALLGIKDEPLPKGNMVSGPKN